MANAVIQNYLNDTTIDYNKRKYVMDQLGTGADEFELADAINTKYGTKYGMFQKPETPDVPSGKIQDNGTYGFSQAAWDAIDERDKKNIAMNYKRLSPQKQTELKGIFSNSSKEIEKIAPSGVSKGLNTAIGAIGAGAQNVGGVMLGVAGEGVKGVGNLVGGLSNIGGQMGDFLTGGLTKKIRMGLGGEEDAGTPIIKAGEEYAKMAHNLREEYLPQGGVGEAIGGIIGTGASMVPALMMGGAAGQATRGSGILSKAGGLTKSLAGGAVESAVGTTGATLGVKGKLPTIKELAIGGGIDVALGGLGVMFKKIAPKIYKIGAAPDVPGTDLTKYMKSDEIAEEAIKMKLTGTKRGIVKKAKNIIKDSGEKLNKIAIGSKKTFQADDIINSAVDRAVELDRFGNRSQADAMMNFITDFRKSQKGVLTTEDVLALKRHAAEVVLPQIKKGAIEDLTTSSYKQVWDEIYTNASKMIDTVEGAKPLNRRMSVAYAVATPTAKAIEKTSKTGLGFLNPQNLPGLTPLATTTAKVLDPLAGTLNNPITKQMAKAQETKSPGSVTKPLTLSGIATLLAGYKIGKNTLNFITSPFK